MGGDAEDLAEMPEGPETNSQGPMGGDQEQSEPMTGPGMDCVPADALSMPDEQEAMQRPDIGDKVSYQCEGTVSEVQGDNIYVKRTSINGQPVEEATPNPAAGQSDDQDMAGLEDMAKQMPQD